MTDTCGFSLKYGLLSRCPRMPIPIGSLEATSGVYTLAPQQQEIRKQKYSTVCGRNPAPVGR